jgi:plastocyanin/uncharacterized membrane protein YozB (DUF420 family)
MLQPGFLGTNASVLSDLSLVLGLLVALTLSVGVIMARLRKFEIHRWVQTSAVVLNVLQVGVVMLGSFMKSAAPGLPQRVSEPYYAVAIAHGLLGLTTLLLGVFIAIRANELLPKPLHFLRFHNFKLFMRTAYGLYMLSTALGVTVYVAWYGPSPKPADRAALQAQAAQDEIVVPMVDFEFAPRDIVVPVGSTIVWVNQDSAPHTATADDGQAFGSDLLSLGQSFRFTATTVGEIPYFCDLHGFPNGEGMAGKIVVVARDGAPVAAAQPPAPAPTPVPTPQPTPGLLALPNTAGNYVNRLLVDGPGLPSKQGYVVGLRRETQELLRHARLLVAAEATGDLQGVRRHAEHAFNLIAGSRDRDFGDRDRDGKPQNAGDGFGLVANGDQPGYIRATLDAAIAAEMAPDASPTIVLHGGHVRVVAVENLHGWATEARSLAFQLSGVNDLAAVGKPAARLLVVAKWLELGNDINADGELTPTAGEGGAFVAYEHARFMAGLGPSHHQ